MLDIVDTAFSYERNLIVCSFLQDFSKEKESNLQLICNAHTVFLLCGTVMTWMLHGVRGERFIWQLSDYINLSP